MSNTFLYVVSVAIWGSTWLAIEFQLGVVAPEVSIVYRYALPLRHYSYGVNTEG